ncbi:TRAP transporter large permease subunit [Arenibaculum sp.]|jgi:tripartite ATP-independent transporter DctM subunit|uniref:TRAP transporter large permease n=1 Tax=Arenibaculum sp. TaxID=2865862 RepID=UPI002E0EDF71|nr:TRAP transporter large permease subunit [Arenibaculum sp.]
MTLAESLPLLMFLALGVLLFSGLPVAFVLGGVGLAFAYVGDWLGVFNAARLVIIPNRIFGGSVENLVLVAIPMFTFMGTMLEKSGVARDLLRCLQLLTWRIPGGLALSVVLMGTILAATTGIIGASVVMISMMALPVMVSQGYDQRLATGTIAASGTLGILIPPSIMLIIMADLMTLPVGTVFMAAVVPGLMLSALYLAYVVGFSALYPERAPPLPAEARPDSAAALGHLMVRSFLPPTFLIVLVLGSIFAGWATPTEASGVGAFGATLLALYNRSLNWAVLKEVCARSALTTAMLFGIFVGATCYAVVFRFLGGEEMIDNFILAMGVGPWGVLFVIMAMVFILGFFFDWIEITLIVLPVFGPIIANLDFGDHVGVWAGVDAAPLVWFTILLSVNLQTSFLTPPFGFALFYMKGVAPPEVTIQAIYRGIIPFVALQLIGLGLCVAFPALVLGLPSWLSS